MSRATSEFDAPTCRLASVAIHARRAITVITRKAFICRAQLIIRSSGSVAMTSMSAARELLAAVQTRIASTPTGRTSAHAREDTREVDLPDAFKCLECAATEPSVIGTPTASMLEATDTGRAAVNHCELDLD